VKARWAVGAAAWAALAAAIWFVGDLLAPLESPLARITLIVAAAAACLGGELWRARRAARSNEALLTGLVGRSHAADSAERAAAEIELLRKRFQDAIEMLRKARFRTREGERGTVAELPWYMFIGAPGSGKTTALLNAGLRFLLGDPRAGEQALQGVGGTRNCDWWFTEQAVLVDTAGRYTTQDSDRQADGAAWLGFLGLLKRHRTRQPLNGVIVTLSIADLVHWNEEELGRYARHVRERLRELHARLGIRLPVYLMVTKADLLAGFDEFFSEFDAAARAQVWGMTFEPREQAPAAAERFKEEFARLERRLYDLLPARLQETRDLQKRAAIYRFPQQYRVTGPLIARFLEAAFAAPAAERPMLRGVYFTSGTQEGSPIDRVLGTLARTFNLERKVQPLAGASGKSYFLKRLLHDVVFGESGLAGLDHGLERRRRLARVAACASFAVLAGALGVVWTASYVANRALITSIESQAASAARELGTFGTLHVGDEAKLISALTRLRQLREASTGEGSSFLHAGLYTGEKLAAQAGRAYGNALREGLLADLAYSLENALRTRPDATVLDAYVSLHDQNRRDAITIAKGALAVWPLADAVRAELQVHLREALAERPLELPRARDEALIEQARRRAGVTRT
jgi:type VI secretion system protein ImpL